jgi:hypothetical protein
VSFSPHLIVQRARVGSATLRQQDARLLDGEPVLVMALALAPPRIWGYMLDSTFDGFVEGYMRPHDGKVSTRIHQGLRVAQTVLRTRIDALLDRRGTDVALLALALDGDVLHLLTAGALRAYVHRQRNLRRLSAQAPVTDGVLKAEPIWCAEPIEQGDLVLAGSASLFHDENLERVRAACATDRLVAPSKVTALLTDADAGHGAVAAAFRVG